MLENPKVRLAIASFFSGLLGLLLALQNLNVSDMSTNDWVQLVVGAVVAALLFGGVSVGTPINKSVGVGAPPKDLDTTPVTKV